MKNMRSCTGKQESKPQELHRLSQSLLRLFRSLESAQSYDKIINTSQQEISTTIGYPRVWVYLISNDLSYAVPLAVTLDCSGEHLLLDHLMSDLGLEVRMAESGERRVELFQQRQVLFATGMALSLALTQLAEVFDYPAILAVVNKVEPHDE